MSPVSFAASNHWQGGFISQTDISTKQETDDYFFCFVLFFMGHVALPQQGVFDLMLEFFFFFFSCDFAACVFCQTEEKCGDL